MLDLWLSSGSEGMNDDMHVYLLEAAIKYFNSRFGTNLKVNYNYQQHDLRDADVERILDVIAVERKISSKKASMACFKVINKRHLGSIRELKCPPEHGLVCHCPPQRMFRDRFYGANIYAIFAVEDKVKCFLCDKERDCGNLNAHFQNECIFNPRPIVLNTFAQ